VPSKVQKFLIDLNDPSLGFEVEAHGQILDFIVSPDGAYLEIYAETYEYNQPELRQYRLYETGQTITAGEYVTTLRVPGRSVLHLYEIR